MVPQLITYSEEAQKIIWTFFMPCGACKAVMDLDEFLSYVDNYLQSLNDFVEIAKRFAGGDESAKEEMKKFEEMWEQGPDKNPGYQGQGG